jgi:fatty acid synthase
MLSVVVTVVPVHVYKELNIIQSAGVEFRGLKTSAISRRKPQSNPVLEKYVFTPNIEPAHLDLHATLRVCIHITLENKPVTKVKVVELHTQGSTPLSPAVALILADKPISKASVTIWNAGSHKLPSSGIHSLIHCLY